MSETETKPATRVERDSMGEMEVPADALYGASTQRAVINFPISGQRFPRRFIRAQALIKRAAAEVNGDLGLLEPARAAAIATAAQEVADGEHDEEFPIDVYQTGSGTSTNTNFNEVIANLASRRLGARVHPNDDVNKCQSSNDTIPTAMQLAAAQSIQDELLPGLERLRAAGARRAGGGPARRARGGHRHQRPSGLRAPCLRAAVRADRPAGPRDAR